MPYWWSAGLHAASWGYPLAVARGPASFKKADVVRLIEAARAAGIKVTGVEFTSDGTLRAIETTTLEERVSDFDRFEGEL